MKKLFLIGFWLISISVFSQSINFGLKAGMSYPTDEGVINAIDVGVKTKGEGAMGFQGGAMLRLKFAGFYLQPEFLYSQFKYKDFDASSDLEVIKKRIDIPVNAGKTFAMGLLQLQTGPVFSIGFDDAIKGIDGSYKYENNKKFNMGWQVGTGVNIKKINLDVRYEFGLSKSSSKLLSRDFGLDYEISSRTNMLNFTVGYFF